MNSYDDIKLEVVKSLNSSILNNAFKKLYSNDNEIVPANDYTPNIWENKWYNDEVIPGYPKGYCVWRNAYTNISSFLSSYGDLVYDYAKSNPLLETYLLSSWTQLSNALYDNLPLMEVWRQRYYNVISGYSKEGKEITADYSKMKFLKLHIYANNAIDGHYHQTQVQSLKFLDLDATPFPVKDHSIPSGIHVFPFGSHEFKVSTNANVIKISGAGGLKEVFTSSAWLGLQTKDGKPISENNPIDIVLEMEEPVLDLKTFMRWNLAGNCCPRSYKLFCSQNNKDWFEVDSVEGWSISRSGASYSGTLKFKKQYDQEYLLPPLFDYGPYSGTDDLRVELYVSLQDDNKEMLSNSNAWSNVVLSSQAEYEKFIKTEVDILFAEHLKNYHLDGSLTPSEINDVLLANNLSNFAIEDVQNTIEVKDHDAYMNTDGFDYVVDFKRFGQKAGNSLAPGKNFYLYRWYRLWNSGFLEHGGVVRCNPIPSVDYEVSNPDNYIVKVDLTWGLGDKATAVYNYDETSGNSFGETYERYYYGDRRGDPSFPIYQQIDPEEKFLNGKHYFARVTPVVLLSSDVNLGTYAYNSISSLAEHDYLSVATRNKVSSYVTTEVHHMKNDSFCFTRSDTDKLDGSAVQYYQYYVTGFKKIIPVDYDFGHAILEGVEAEYAWTGSVIKPNPKVKNNLGDILQQDRDYSLLYYAPGGEEADFIDGPEVNIQVKGLKPYVGMQTLQYKIVKTK